MRLGVLFLMLMVSLIGYSQQSGSPVKLNKIGDNLFEVVDGRGAKGGAFIGENGIILIDTKQDEFSVKQTLDELGKLTDKKVEYIINTHSDGDHVTGNRFFPNGIKIIAHENCRKEMLLPKRDGSPSDWAGDGLKDFLPSIVFSKGMTLYSGNDKIQLFYFGIGHTTGDIVVYFEKDKIAFIGDQVFKGRTQLIHSYKGGNTFEHVKTLEKIVENIDSEKFYTGHSAVLNKSDISEHIAAMKKMQSDIAGYIKDGLVKEQILEKFGSDKQALAGSVFNELSNK